MIDRYEDRQSDMNTYDNPKIYLSSYQDMADITYVKLYIK